MSTPHTVLFPVIVALKGYPATFMASQSKDGSLVSFVLQKAGFGVIRGSSSRGAVAGLSLALKEVLPGRIVGLTFDGPKGPPCVPKKGVALLVKHSSGTSYIVVVRLKKRFFGLYNGCVHLNSWDRFHLLFPFASFEIEAVPIPSKEPEAYLEFLKDFSLKTYGNLYTDARKVLKT
jgi:hypothetical protein